MTAEEVMHLSPSRPTVVLTGQWDPTLRIVVEEFLTEAGLEVRPLAKARPSLVLAIVKRHDVGMVVGLLRAHFRGVPIVAVLSAHDTVLDRDALEAGAAACYALDGPFADLRAAIQRAGLDVGEPHEATAARP